MVFGSNFLVFCNLSPKLVRFLLQIANTGCTGFLDGAIDCRTDGKYKSRGYT